MDEYRVARRPEPDLSGWGFWSDTGLRWMDVIYATEREATETLEQLVVLNRRSK
ncbi:hypothetical protein [Sphingomonas sp. ZB1N12]|uniref:hypothetical protein n=1 Tax=Sphingomonas arabinosi TaxID=3096160 RepID=UPI002FCB597C